MVFAGRLQYARGAPLATHEFRSVGFFRELSWTTTIRMHARAKPKKVDHRRRHVHAHVCGMGLGKKSV